MRSAHLHAASRESLPPTIGGNRYRVEGAIGRGGAAQLYRVVDETSDRTLALKVLHAGAHAKLRELFELEYQTLASLDHPRIPQVFDFGSDPLGLFYTMELLEGGDLSASAPLPWRTVAAHLRDASEALGLLHARKLIHRDVSPRNLWRSPNGRMKLIDFGALAPFGTNTQVIGTPPLIPPEALASRALDQRADLYALGGVAYFLLTGSHAYPARSLDELRELWGRKPPPPSERSAQLQRATLECIPAEVDALVMALLSEDELARPSSTAEVIDRIDSLCGVGQESEREAYGRIANPDYAGPRRELRHLKRRFELAARGRGQACVIESAPGGGRSRALRELERAARVSQASVLYVDAAAHDGLYGVAAALALALLDATRDRGRAAAEPYAPVLAHLSAEVRERLGVAAAPLPEIAGELRVRMQEAQRDWLLSVAHERPLVVLVDGLERTDDSSAAFLLGLGLGLGASKLLLVCSLVRDRMCEQSAAVRAYVKAAHGVHLPPLRAADMHALLYSVFGAAEHLSRLSGRLFEQTRGNPGYALELCRQLVERGVIRFDSGTWLLPQELDMNDLPAGRDQALLARMSRLAGPARDLARLLSVHTGPLAPGMCRALATSQGNDLLPHLSELLSAGVLVASGPRLHFAHELIRESCAGELASEPLQRVRRALAQQLLAAADAGATERLQAGVHLIAAEDARGPAMVVGACSQLFFHEVDKLASVAPMMEAALRLLRARNTSKYEEITLLAALVLAGYEGDRRYVQTYGEPAVHALEALLELPRARVLSRFIGSKLGLSAALAIAALGFLQQRKDPCVPGFVDAMKMLFTAGAAAAGACSICIDPQGAARFAEVLQPFAALGPQHLGGFMCDFVETIAHSARDRYPVAIARWRSLLARIDHTKVFEHEPEAQRRRMRGGILTGIAGIEAQRDGKHALRAADELEQNGQQLDRMSADQIRMIYYGSNGDMASYEYYRERAEHHAVARGTSWQIETWSAGSASGIALNLHDALGMKRASEKMRRLSEHIPALAVHARHIRGAYLLLRERYAEAVPLLEDCLREAPGSRGAWARSHGVLARAYNRLGDHARAHAACARVLEHYTEADFVYVNLNLIVQTEHILAEAGLGHVKAAQEQLARLHAQHAASENPLVRGQLLETGFELALLAHELPAALEQLAQIEALYRPLKIPSLAQQCQRLATRVAQLDGGKRDTVRESPTPTASAAPRAEQPWSFDVLNTGERLRLDEHAQRALRVMAAAAEASAGAFYVVDYAVDAPASPRLAATLSGGPPSSLVEHWIVERCARELEDEHTVLETEVDHGNAPWNLMQEAELTHRMLVLTAEEGQIVGFVVLGRPGEAPLSCPGALLRTVGCYVYEALSAEQTEHPRSASSSDD